MAAKKAAPKTAAKRLVNAETKKVGGRPTKYQPAYVEQARKLASLGMTNERMSDFFEVSLSTFHLWREAHSEFSDALKAGKEDADASVAASLYRAALGGATVTEAREEVDAEGNVVTKKAVKELPANVTAQIFWLKNRQPHQWRDKVVVADETPPEVLAETAMRFDEVMRAARERQRRILVERGILPA
jgi:hypothetical protein